MNCPNCNSSWNDSIAINLTKCPLCQHDLTKTTNTVDTSTPEGILQRIVKQFTPEIYNESIKFKSILSDYLVNDKKLLKVLKIIIDNNGASDIYKNSSLDVNQFNLKVRTMLLRVSDDSLVAQDVLSDGAILLCKGLGKDFAYSNNQSNNDNNTTQLKSAQPKPIQPKSNTKQPSSDFEIKNGELIKYLGNGGDVVIPNSVSSIGESAFDECSSLTNITIPNSVSSIGNYAFYGCSSLANITIPNSVSSIEELAFSCCSSLANITIPDSVTTLGKSAFVGCSSLTNITIPESVSSIGDSAFSRCSSLANITIPNSVTSIGESAFDSYSSLKTVILPHKLKYDPSIFFNCHPDLEITKY